MKSNKQKQTHFELHELHFPDFDYFTKREDNNNNNQNNGEHYHRHQGNERDFVELEEDEKNSFEEYRKSYEYYDHRNEKRYWNWNHEERLEDEESGRSFQAQSEYQNWTEKYPSLYQWWYSQMWIVSFSALSAGLSYWIPNMWWPDASKPLECINFNLVVLNASGAALIAFATEMNAVKYQYPQTYFVYNALKNGFCSGWTTFANVIEDTGRLFFNGLWWEGLLNTWINLVSGFITYRLVQLAVRWYKRHIKELSDDAVLNTVDRRMSIELDKQLRKADLTTSPKAAIYSSGRKSIDDIGFHYRKQHIKKRSKASPFMQRSHWVILVAVWLAMFTCFAYVYWFQDYLPYWVEKSIAVYDFIVFTTFTVVAAQFGGWLGSIPAKKSYVHWGTFKVNMCSSIFAGLAHLILMFKNYIPGSDIYFTAAVYRFIGGFCGTASSFAGLIDDTVIIFQCNNPGAKRRALKNVYYNWFLSLVMFHFVVLVVRMAIFFRYFGPTTAKYYLCGSFEGLC